MGGGLMFLSQLELDKGKLIFVWCVFLPTSTLYILFLNQKSFDNTVILTSPKQKTQLAHSPALKCPCTEIPSPDTGLECGREGHSSEECDQL